MRTDFEEQLFLLEQETKRLKIEQIELKLYDVKSRLLGVHFLELVNRYSDLEYEHGGQKGKVQMFLLRFVKNSLIKWLNPDNGSMDYLETKLLIEKQTLIWDRMLLKDLPG